MSGRVLVSRRVLGALAAFALAGAAACRHSPRLGAEHLAEAEMVERTAARAIRSAYSGRRLGFQDTRLAFEPTEGGSSQRRREHLAMLLADLGATSVESLEEARCPGIDDARCLDYVVAFGPPLVDVGIALVPVYFADVRSGARFERTLFLRLLGGRALAGSFVDSLDLHSESGEPPDTHHDASTAALRELERAAARVTRAGHPGRRLGFQDQRLGFEQVSGDSSKREPTQVDAILAELGARPVEPPYPPSCSSTNNEEGCLDYVVRIGQPVIAGVVAVVTVYGDVIQSRGQFDRTHLFRKVDGAWEHRGVIDSRDAR